MEESEENINRTGVKIAAWVLLLIVLLLAVWQLSDALLLTFLAILAAVFLRGLAGLLSRVTRLPERWSVVAVIILLVLLGSGVGFWLGPRLTEQFGSLSKELTSAVQNLQKQLQNSEAGRFLLRRLPDDKGLELNMQAFRRITAIAWTTVDILTALVFVLVGGAFLAFRPAVYLHGVTQLFPRDRRDRIEETLKICGIALWHWLGGRLVSMAFVGIVSALVFALLGLEVPIALGLLTGLLDFIPFVGPLLAAIPAFLVGLGDGISQGLYAVLVIVAVNQLEGNVVTPLIQQRVVSLPPALVLFGVLAAGLLAGLIGVIVATPILLVAVIVVKLLYVEDVLHTPTTVPGRDS